MNNDRYLVVISGPSGSGKDTIVNKLLTRRANTEVSVSATSRAMRPGEKEGENYYYLTVDEFKNKIENGEILEYTCFCGNYYGTPKSEVDKRAEKKITTILVIEVEGAQNIKQMYPECTTIFVQPPSYEELRRRLYSRNTDSPEAIEKRLKRATEEMEYAPSYDFSVINDDLDKCVQEVCDIIDKRQQD